MKSEGELLEKYKNRNLKEELSWASYYTRKGYMSAEYEDYYRWLALAAYNRIKELEATEWDVTCDPEYRESHFDTDEWGQ